MNSKSSDTGMDRRWAFLWAHVHLFGLQLPVNFKNNFRDTRGRLTILAHATLVASLALRWLLARVKQCRARRSSDYVAVAERTRRREDLLLGIRLADLEEVNSRVLDEDQRMTGA